MAMVFLTLLAAIWAGLIRLGWALPLLNPTLPASHGPLMISALGTLISMERAVALSARWTYSAPLLSGIGAVGLMLGVPASPFFVALGSLGLLFVSIFIVYRHQASYTVIMGLGALAWLAGNLLWLSGSPVASIVPWWIGFLVLTIAGERLELSRVSRPTPLSRILFIIVTVVIVVGMLVTLATQIAGVRMMSLGLLALALWLGLFDIARYTVRKSGVTRFIAVNLLLGYMWLAISGLLGLRFAGATAGPYYDAWLHAFFLGFVLSMIFAHSLIILPAVVGLSAPYHRIMYGPIILLQAGLLLRVTGDLALWLPVRQWGGLLNAIAIIWFFLQTVLLTARQHAIAEKRPAPG
jgi:hypothetical protein